MTLSKGHLSHFRQVELGRRIRALRLARGLSQEDLAGPYSRAYVSLIEAGGIQPSERGIQTLAERLGVEPSAIVAGSRIPC